jgi:hypothetical protein
MNQHVVPTPRKRVATRSITCPPPETVPSIDGYYSWIQNFMGVPDEALPSDSIYICVSYEYAIEMVNYYLYLASPILYTQAVYNLAGDFLVNIAQDDPNATPPYNTYWTDLRQKMQINNFVPGLINATNDQDTSAAIMTPFNLQNLTLADLQNLKTPWGRMYLSIAQSVGSMWGLTI